MGHTRHRHCREDHRAERQRAEGERGAALVEFALVAPLIAALILFLATGAIAFDRNMALTHAAEEGARYGATISPAQTFTSGTWASNVRDLVISRAGGELDPSTGTSVCVALVEGNAPTVRSVPNPAGWYTTNADGSVCDAGDLYPAYSPPFDDGLRVQVVVSAEAQLEAVAFSRTVTLDATAVARSEAEA